MQAKTENEDAEYDVNETFEAFKGVFTITCKSAVKLPPMDTFSGKADPYLLLSLDGMLRQTKVKTATLSPVWNEKMQVTVFSLSRLCG